jgi:hypothetical protein
MCICLMLVSRNTHLAEDCELDYRRADEYTQRYGHPLYVCESSYISAGKLE